VNAIISKLLSNPHTTGAGLGFVIVKVGKEVALVWFPQQADKIKATADLLEGVAAFYGLALAGDAGKGKEDLEAVKKDVARLDPGGNTATLYRKDLPVSVEPPKTGI
jgi:hypothetical protein